MTDTTDPTKPVAWMRWNEAAATSTGVTDTEYYRDLWTAEGDTVVPLVRLSEYERVKARSEAAEGELSIVSVHLDCECDSDAILHVIRETETDLRIYKDRSEALEAEVKRLREAFVLPQDVVESLLAIGLVEWGVSLTQSDEKHASDLLDTLRLTREHFDMPVEETGIHGVYLEGTGTVLAHTGMSPNSPQHARILAGAWNQLVDMARALEASRCE